MSAKKPDELRQRGKSRAGEHQNTGIVLALAPNVPLVPAPKPHWRDEVVEGWNDYWSSHMATEKFLKPTDRPALLRLFDFRHRLLEALDSFDAEPIVAGSTGQPTLSPWAQEVHRLEGVVEKLESSYALTPLSRFKLGVTYEEGVSLAARNAQLLEAFRTSQGS